MTTSGTTKRYVWDVRNRMSGIDSNNDGDTSDVGDFNYAYDSDGVRISESTKISTVSRTTFYLNDPQNPTGYTKAIEERTVATNISTNAQTTALRSFALGQKVEAQADATNGMLYLMTDGHGSTRALINSTSGVVQTFEYDAFGTPIGFAASSAKSPWLFGGDGLYDPASKFTYHLAGWRDGFRFTSYDSFEADPATPVGLHKYDYADEAPISRFDPSGHDGLLEVLTVAGINAFAMGFGLSAIANALGAIHSYNNPVTRTQHEPRGRWLTIANGFSAATLGIGLGAQLQTYESLGSADTVTGISIPFSVNLTNIRATPVKLLRILVSTQER